MLFAGWRAARVGAGSPTVLLQLPDSMEGLVRSSGSALGMKRWILNEELMHWESCLQERTCNPAHQVARQWAVIMAPQY